jgi:hypothetical protein
VHLPAEERAKGEPSTLVNWTREQECRRSRTAARVGLLAARTLRRDNVLRSNRETILERAAGGIRDPEDAAVKGVAEVRASTGACGFAGGRQSVQVLGRCQGVYPFAG